MSSRSESWRVSLSSAAPVAAEARRSAPTWVIEPSGRWPALNVRELWTYRDLLLFLVWREVKVRYAQTLLGAGWAILQPLLTVAIFTVIFGLFARIPSDGVPYPVFSLAALVPWTYFATAMTGASNSLVTDRNLITKVYFPRLVIPWAPVLAGLMDFAVAFLLLLGVMLAYGVVPQAAALWWIPGLVAVCALTAAGVGCWLAALNIQYRDIRYVIPFLVQVWMYASPVLYPTSLVPERYRLAYGLNPMVAVIEGFRSALLGTPGVGAGTVALSVLTSLLLFVTGALYFRRTERAFADVA